MQAPLDMPHWTSSVSNLQWSEQFQGLLQVSSRLCQTLGRTPALGDVPLGVSLSARQRLDSEPVGVPRGHEQHMLHEAPGMTPWTPKAHRPGRHKPLGGPKLAACELFVSLHPRRVHGGSTPRLR